MNLFDLYARVSLDTTGFDAGIAKASASGASLTTRLSGIFNGISSLGASVMKSIGVAAGVGITALGGFVKSSVETSMEFDKAMSQVAATMGYTVDELHDETSKAYEDYHKLSDAASYYGETTAFTATQAAEA